eukprot:SAG11_NODE_15701_length_569_cov_0.621277_1_plen_63_part_10
MFIKIPNLVVPVGLPSLVLGTDKAVPPRLYARLGERLSIIMCDGREEKPRGYHVLICSQALGK